MLNLRRILCPTDFSELSYEALRVASHFAERFDAKIDILHVVPFTYHPEEYADLGVQERSFRQKTITPLEVHERSKQRMLPTVIPRSLTRMGQPAEEIVRVAHDENADLIVMGTHGLTGWRHLVLGSVAEAVVSTAPCPVLTVHEPREESQLCVEQPHRILCSTDFSEPSFCALDVACKLAERFDSEILLFHAVEWIGDYQGVFLQRSQIYEEICEESLQTLTEIIQKRVPAPIKARGLARIGSAAPSITDAAAEEGADMIVIATHGLTGWRHLLLGSVAETVVRSAPCGVLTVPIPRGQIVQLNNGNGATAQVPQPQANHAVQT